MVVVVVSTTVAVVVSITVTVTYPAASPLGSLLGAVVERAGYRWFGADVAAAGSFPPLPSPPISGWAPGVLTGMTDRTVFVDMVVTVGSGTTEVADGVDEGVIVAGGVVEAVETDEERLSVAEDEDEDE